MSATDYAQVLAADTAANEVDALTSLDFGMVRFRTRITVADGRFRLHLGRRYICLESLRVKICYVKRWRCTGPGRVCLKLPKASLRVWRRLNALRGVILWLIDERGHVMGLHLFRCERGKHGGDIRRPGTESWI